jgi:hypothetical protein
LAASLKTYVRTACPSPCCLANPGRRRPASSAQGATTGVELAAAALVVPFLSTFEPSQHHQEIQAVELCILRPFPRQVHQSTTAA